MPSAERISWARLRVGIMAVVAISLVFVLVFLLTSDRGFFEEQAPIYTFLNDSYALTSGAPVRLNGIRVGQISGVSLSGSENPQRAVQVEMQVESEMLPKIPQDSEVRVAAENVLGSKFLNIKIGQSDQHVQRGGELRSQDTQGFEDVVASGYSTMETVRELVERIDLIVRQIEQGEGSIGKFISDPEFYDRLTATVRETELLVTQVRSGDGTIGRLMHDDTLYNQLSTTLTRMDQIVARLEQGEGTAGKLLSDPSLYNEAKGAVADLRTTIQNLNEGKGTAGKLLTDDALYARLNDVIASLDNTIEKINTGQGTLGQLMVNPSLYENLEGTTREMKGLMQDFRSNPKKFLRIKLALF